LAGNDVPAQPNLEQTRIGGALTISGRSAATVRSADLGGKQIADELEIFNLTVTWL
jgi:hypothetical protein